MTDIVDRLRQGHAPASCKAPAAVLVRCERGDCRCAREDTADAADEIERLRAEHIVLNDELAASDGLLSKASQLLGCEDFSEVPIEIERLHAFIEVESKAREGREALLQEIERLRGDLATSEAGIESLKDRFAAAVGRGLRVTVLERENDELRARLRIAVDLLEEIANAKAGEAIFWGKAELIVKVQACQDLRTRFGLQDDARALVEKIKGELR